MFCDIHRTLTPARVDRPSPPCGSWLFGDHSFLPPSWDEILLQCPRSPDIPDGEDKRSVLDLLQLSLPSSAHCLLVLLSRTTRYGDFFSAYRILEVMVLSKARAFGRWCSPTSKFVGLLRMQCMCRYRMHMAHTTMWECSRSCAFPQYKQSCPCPPPNLAH